MTNPHANARLEAFCDGVFAIALTLLILDVKLPSPASITSTAELWRALRHLAPSVFAFGLSFSIILITWVNHHAALKLVTRSSASFIYANGFLLLSVVAIPFTAGLLGSFLGRTVRHQRSCSTMASWA
jgi:TMEM175 potassium channel family protein